MRPAAIQAQRPYEIPRIPAQAHALLGRIVQIAEHAIIIRAGLTSISSIPSYLPTIKSVLSHRVIQLSENILSAPLRHLRDTCVNLLPPFYTTFQYGRRLKTNWTFLLVTSSVEEIIFRSCIQSILLTKIPKLTLRKIAPSYENLVDHKITQIARIIFTSLLFALAHVARLKDHRGMLLPQFLVGIYLSLLREQKFSILDLSIIHFTINTMNAFLVGGFAP
jgi:membrane protease YdiL (CAAX protease family)